MPRRRKASKSDSIVKANMDLSEGDTTVMPGMSAASTPCRTSQAASSQQLSELVSSVLALREAIEDIRRQGDETRKQVNAVREQLNAKDDESHEPFGKPELVSTSLPSKERLKQASVASEINLGFTPARDNKHSPTSGHAFVSAAQPLTGQLDTVQFIPHIQVSTTLPCVAHAQSLDVPQVIPSAAHTMTNEIMPDVQSLIELPKRDVRVQQPEELTAMPSLPVQPSESAMLYGAGYNYKLYPLPPFDGTFEEWPLFYACYKDTTSEFRYNNKQNLMRLNKALHGDTKRAVTSLLIYPDDVPKVIDELNFNFGRPELLVRSQQEKIARIPAIPEHRLESILPLSNQVRNMVALFKSAGCTHHLMNPTLLEQLINKLPPTKQFEWAKYVVSLDFFPSVETFSCWVADLAKVVNIMSYNVCPEPSTQHRSQQLSTQYRQTGNAKSQSGQASRRILHSSEVRPEQPKLVCECCGQCHCIRDCEEFAAMSIDDKWKRVKHNRLCFGCLKKGHSLSICQRKKVCAIQGCKRMHNSLLHQNVPLNKPNAGTESGEYLMNCHKTGGKTHLFKIVPVVISGPSGSMSTYAMIDEGSSISLIEDHVAVALGLRGHVMPLTLQWYGDKKKKENARKISISIKGKYEGAASYCLKNIFAISELSLPQQSLNVQDYAQLKDIPVIGYRDAKPVILLGLDNAFLGSYDEIIENGPHWPIAAKTKLGWIAFGPLSSQPCTEARVVHIRPTLKGLHDMMEEYFTVECFGVKKTELVMESDEDRRAREILANTTRKFGNSYETGLLWKHNNIEFPSSVSMAYNRLLKIEGRMKRDAMYAAAYIDEMRKYIDKGYAYLLSPQEAEVKTPTTWYLPHFGVVNPNKPGKLRIVFDAAAVTSGYSLNSALLKGPEHAQSLFTIMYRFRQGIIAVAADIQEMFSQIQIRPEDRNAQRFLWRDGDTSKLPDTYVMKSMTFGAACSPCCAEYVKNINAMSHQTEMPRGTKAVIENMYVDDLVASFNSNHEAMEICQEAVSICAAAGFNVRSFVSNSKTLERKFNGKASLPTVIYVDRKTSNEKVLGTYWNTTDDTFGFQFKFNKVPKEVLECHRPPTKREMLGIVMSIFDPFGFLANIAVSAKYILQKTWKIAIQWDDLLPLPLCTHWFGWWEEFKKVEGIKIPRCYSPMLFNADNIQLHIFVDASASAYAAVAYLRITAGNQINVTFVAAKTRCAPVKGMTIPRLELQTALLGCRLGTSIVQWHEFEIQRTVFWSDSQTVIQWIRSTTRQYKQFVACRIAEIVTTTSPNQWHWLPTTLNVADEATRGNKPATVGLNTKWLQGPEFLRQEENICPNEDLDLSCLTCTEEESNRIMTINVDNKQVLDYTRFSSYLKLLRVTAWVIRFIHNIKRSSQPNEVRCGELVAEELSAAEKTICVQIQGEAYQEEIVALKAGGTISKTSEIFQLTPKLEDDGLLHVRGRIDAAYCLPITARRPIIMPRTHYLTRLLVAYYHQRLHHQNDQLVINEMRQKFWVPGARVILKSIKQRCSTCVLLRARPVTPLMGQLPADRVTPYIRPFSYTGVDYCGPFMVAVGRRREKRWIALFTCLTTRAIHLEVAEDLSTDAFLICLRNFVNRRGTPVKIRSDNGTNFIGAQRLLKNEERFFDLNQIRTYTSKANISWEFNCPAYPNAGGCWERLIQCVKRLLARTLKEEAPKLETFRSVLIEAENIVNSRPLTDIPLTSEDDEPLTPNHFLLGCPNSTQTPSTSNEDVCLRKQWRIAQNLKDRLWKKWTVEYLPQLLRRPKWRKEVVPLKVDQLVLVCDPSLPRGQWQMGRIVRVFPARDGQVRSAQIRTKQGLIKRPANKLAALEFSESL